MRSFVKIFPKVINIFKIYSKYLQIFFTIISPKLSHCSHKIRLKFLGKFLIVPTKLITNSTKISWYKLLVTFLISLKLSIFFDQRISSKFTLFFFKIFLNVSFNIFKICWTFSRNFTNFLVLEESSHFFKISSWFFKFGQKCSEVILKILQRLHGIFSDFPHPEIYFRKIYPKYHNFSDYFHNNSNKIFVKVFIEIPYSHQNWFRISWKCQNNSKNSL